MKTRIIMIVTAILIVTALGYSAAQGQALPSVMERINGINGRLAALEAAQKKVGPPAGSESAVMKAAQAPDTAIEHSLAILQMRIDALSAGLARLEADMRPTVEAPKPAAAPTLAVAVAQPKAVDSPKPAEAPTLAVAVAQPKAVDPPAAVSGVGTGAPPAKRDSLPAAPQQSFLQVKYPVSFYGYVKLDGSYDGAYANAGNYMRWVDTTGHGDGQFNITARQTRLGLNLGGPKITGTESGGKLEIDFYGGGEENKNLLMLRQAYMKFAWTTIDLSVIAGQTNDVISPLNPATLNYVVGWWAGNIGYRRPQLRLTKGFNLGRNVGLRFELAAARSIGGENTGLPGGQGRMALSVPVLAGKKMTLGVYGHVGREENKSHTWSAGADLSIPLLSKTTVEGEFWTGENLDSYLGGIGQGLKGTAQQPLGINARGGWASLNTGPYAGWQFAIGSGIDDPSDSHLTHGDKTQNMSTFGNIRYSLNEAVETGIELSSWRTKYKNMDDATSIRVQWSWQYKF